MVNIHNHNQENSRWAWPTNKVKSLEFQLVYEFMVVDFLKWFNIFLLSPFCIISMFSILIALCSLFKQKYAALCTESKWQVRHVSWFNLGVLYQNIYDKNANSKFSDVITLSIWQLPLFGYVKHLQFVHIKRFTFTVFSLGNFDQIIK